MKRKKFNLIDYSFVYTIILFVLGLININLIMFALVCYISPFVIAYIKKKKIWCTSICPRSSFFMKIISKISFKKKAPKWLVSKRAKNIVLLYFGINMTMVLLSTIVVSLGRVQPLEELRFFMFFRITSDLPQMFIHSISPVLTHLSYRLYSMVLTTSIIGIILGILYKPKSWCVVCPVMTITNMKPFRK